MFKRMFDLIKMMEVIMSFVNFDLLRRIPDLLRGKIKKPEPKTTPEEQKPETKSNPFEVDRNDEIAFNNFFNKFTGARRELLVEFYNSFRQKNPWKAHTFRTHFLKEMEENEGNAVTKCEALIDFMIVTKSKHKRDWVERTIERCFNEQYTYDSTEEAIKFFGDKALKGVATVCKKINKAGFVNVSNEALLSAEEFRRKSAVKKQYAMTRRF